MNLPIQKRAKLISSGNSAQVRDLFPISHQLRR